MEDKKVKISELRKVPGIGNKTIEKIKKQIDVSEYISEYDKGMHLSKNTVYQGDCLELMNGIPDKSVDMILCDLPYGTTWAEWDSVIDFDKIWSQYNRVIKNKGAIVLFSNQPFTTRLINSNLTEYKYTWYWVKNSLGNYLNAKYQPLRKLEEINVFHNHKYYPQGVVPYNRVSYRGSSSKTTMQNYKNNWLQTHTGYPHNVLEFDLDKNKLHPTQKPVKLLEYLIKTYTKEGEVILDNCIGSGSTAVAAIKTNREYIGIELKEEYVNMANKRIENVK